MDIYKNWNCIIMAFKLRSGNKPNFKEVSSKVPFALHAMRTPFAKDDKEDKEEKEEKEEVEASEPEEAEKFEPNVTDDSEPNQFVAAPQEESFDFNQVVEDKQKEVTKEDNIDDLIPDEKASAVLSQDGPDAQAASNTLSDLGKKKISNTVEKKVLGDTIEGHAETSATKVLKNQADNLVKTPAVKNAVTATSKQAMAKAAKKKLAKKLLLKTALKAVPIVGQVSTAIDVYKGLKYAYNNQDAIKGWANRFSGNFKNSLSEWGKT
jgi:hypothetical protein